MLLYLHIPFCDSKCHYCAFNSYTKKHNLIPSYMDAVCKEFEKNIENFTDKFETLFIGGGTPSTVDFKMYERFFELLRPFLREDAEITAEANPNSASKEWLEGMRALGVNRVSLGVQSFFEDKLKLLGRAHDPKRAKEAVFRAKEAGFSHINIDLIYSTALDSKERLLKELDFAFSLPIDHISAYALTLEENTPFENRFDLQKDDANTAIFFANEIKRRGFSHYEISNFGSYKSKHNLGYWQYKEYMGVGAGAVGYIDGKRLYSHNLMEKYIDDPFFKKEEILSDRDKKIEKIFLGFRSEVGVDERIFDKEEFKKVTDLVKEGKLFLKDKRVYNKDFFLADEIVLYIIN